MYLLKVISSWISYSGSLSLLARILLTGKITSWRRWFTIQRPKYALYLSAYLLLSRSLFAFPPPQRHVAVGNVFTKFPARVKPVCYSNGISTYGLSQSVIGQANYWPLKPPQWLNVLSIPLVLFSQIQLALKFQHWRNSSRESDIQKCFEQWKEAPYQVNKQTYSISIMFMLVYVFDSKKALWKSLNQ